MRNLLLAVAILMPASARADDKPYILINGRAVAAPTGSPAGSNTMAPPQTPAVVDPMGGKGAADVGAAVAAAQAAGAMVPPSPSGQAVTGKHGRRRHAGGRGNNAIRRADGDTTDAPPPYFNKAGALIRTEGQLPAYSDPGDARTHTVEGGGAVAIDTRKAHDSGGAGVHWGSPDKHGSTGGSGAGGNAVTSNDAGSSSPSGGAKTAAPSAQSTGSGFDPSF